MTGRRLVMLRRWVWLGATLCLSLVADQALAQDDGELSDGPVDDPYPVDDVPVDAPAPVDAPPPADAPYEDPPATYEAPVEVALDAGQGSFDLNSVLVATFEANQTFLEREADRVRHLVEDALGQAYVVVKMDEVPAFTDYSADIYLRSCPQGQYIGCVFVVGGRAQTDWTIGGRVSAVDGGYQVFLQFIKVSEAKLRLEFDVVLDGSNDAEFKEGVARTMDALVTNTVDDLDLRADPEAVRRQQEEAQRREELSRDFAEGTRYDERDERGDVGLDAYVSDRDETRELEDDDGGGFSDDSDASSRGRSGKVTWSDLAAMEDRGGLTPWERAGLTKAQYKLYRNSGLKLRDFKAKLQGRKGEVLIGLGMNVSSGPWAQVEETYYALDNAAVKSNLKAKDILGEVSTIYNDSALAFGGQLDLGVGLLPWMELRAFGGIRSAPFAYRFYDEREGQQGSLGEFTARSVTTFQAGLKLGFVPMPAYPARPTFHIGVSYWQGTPLQKVVDLSSVSGLLLAEQFRPLALVYVHAQPGFEISAGKYVAIYARADLDLPVYNFGRAVYATAKDYQVLTRKPVQPEGSAFGIGGSLGLTLRIRVAGDR